VYLGVGARYTIHPPFILFLMAGRSVQGARNGQPYSLSYFGMQFLLPLKPFERNDLKRRVAYQRQSAFILLNG
jgi:hypothetical protein